MTLAEVRRARLRAEAAVDQVTAGDNEALAATPAGEMLLELMGKSKQEKEQWEWEQDDDDTNLDNGCALKLVRKQDGYAVLLPNFFKSGSRAGEPAWIEIEPEHAQLIAAAPELLEACERLERYAREVCKHKSARMTEDALEELLADAIIAAGTAVAKAKGKRP